MPNCSAIVCIDRSSDANCTVPFHRLPATNRDVWLAKIKREGGEKLTDLRTCSNHFEKDCFEWDMKADLMGTKPKAQLKNISSTIFMFNANTEKRKLPEARNEKSSKEQYIDDACCNIQQDEHVSDEHVTTLKVCRRTIGLPKQKLKHTVSAHKPIFRTQIILVLIPS